MPDELKRFQQSVRSRVRQHVREHREPPPLTLWASEAGNPRRVAACRVGAAADAQGVRSNIVGALRERESSFAAIGRGLHVDGEEGERELEPTTLFGVVFVTASVLTTVNAEIVAGDMGPWRPASEIVTAEERSSEGNAWLFVQQAVRSIEKIRREREEVAAIEAAMRRVTGQ